MIIYVDIEHARVQEDREKWKGHLAKTLKIKYRLEQLSDDNCLVVRYDKIDLELLRQLHTRAVLVSGNLTELQHYSDDELAGLRAVLREGARPTIGFCGGAQMMAEAFGSRAAAINEAESGDMMDDKWKERTHESGFMLVRKTAPHPLFAGLADDMVFLEAHYWEIKSVPQGFELFAESEISPIQFMAHSSLPIFGTQFHPEAFDEAHPDGRIFLENFFKLMD